MKRSLKENYIRILKNEGSCCFWDNGNFFEISSASEGGFMVDVYTNDDEGFFQDDELSLEFVDGGHCESEDEMDAIEFMLDASTGNQEATQEESPKIKNLGSKESYAEVLKSELSVCFWDNDKFFNIGEAADGGFMVDVYSSIDVHQAKENSKNLEFVDGGHCESEDEMDAIEFMLDPDDNPKVENKGDWTFISEGVPIGINYETESQARDGCYIEIGSSEGCVVTKNDDLNLNRAKLDYFVPKLSTTQAKQWLETLKKAPKESTIFEASLKKDFKSQDGESISLEMKSITVQIDDQYHSMDVEDKFLEIIRGITAKPIIPVSNNRESWLDSSAIGKLATVDRDSVSNMSTENLRPVWDEFVEFLHQTQESGDLDPYVIEKVRTDYPNTHFYVNKDLDLKWVRGADYANEKADVYWFDSKQNLESAMQKVNEVLKSPPSKVKTR